MLIAALLLGALVGIVLGLVGAGGSIIAVPALVYGVGLPLDQAIPTSLAVVGLSSTIAVIPRIRSGVDWRIAALVGAAGVPAAWAGTAIGRPLDQDVLLLVFSFGVGGGFLIVPALYLLLGIPFARAAGTSLVIIVVNSLAGLSAHAVDLHLDWAVLSAFAAVAIAASLASALLARRVPDKALRRGFAVLVFVTAAVVAVGSVAALLVR